MVPSNSSGSYAGSGNPYHDLDTICDRNEGADWRLATRKVALWYKPMYPRQHADVPNREAELTKLLKKRTAHPDKSFTAAVRRADDWIKAQTSDASGFFKLEDDNAPVPLHTLFESEARAQFGGDWFLEDFDDVFTRVMDTPFWEPALLRLIGL